MLLYHATTRDFKIVNLEQSKAYRDFGKGFYLTPSESSSLNILKQNNGFLLSFDFDNNLAEIDLNIKVFETDNDWFDYVYLNRTTEYLDNYDIVIGKTASNCFKQFKQIRNGIPVNMNCSDLLNNAHGIQYCFKTEKALDYLYLLEKEYLTKEDFY